jgi:hypothetical protein
VEVEAIEYIERQNERIHGLQKIATERQDALDLQARELERL